MRREAAVIAREQKAAAMEQAASAAERKVLGLLQPLVKVLRQWRGRFSRRVTQLRSRSKMRKTKLPATLHKRPNC